MVGVYIDHGLQVCCQIFNPHVAFAQIVAPLAPKIVVVLIDTAAVHLARSLRPAVFLVVEFQILLVVDREVPNEV